MRSSHLALAAGYVLALAPAVTAESPEPIAPLGDLRTLTIEELANVEITSVSLRPESVAQAPASVYVIQGSDISGIGATSLPEALRLAPNLQVSRDSAPAWAVTARGFNSFETANKLLVMVDGRSIYAPLHSGVLWDEETVFLDDIDRIEVISGPGGATWGANAVNGVINVISRDAFATDGVLLRGSTGNVESFAAARYGRRLGENAAVRLYGQGFDRENSLTAAGADANDDFDGLSGGFRFDMDSGGARWTLQGDIFDHDIENAGDVTGGNLLARWSKANADGGSLQVQAWADRSERSGPGVTTRTDQADISFRQVLAPLGRHRIVWGAGYRYIDDLFVAQELFTLQPPEASFGLWTGFVQDTITLNDSLSLRAGLKLEDSGYSGFEYLPSVRLAWTPDDATLLWAAISRAVRTPVRLDRDLVAPGLFIGGPNFDSEKLIAYGAGYRGRFGPRLSLSATVFLNDYDDLRTTELSATAFPGQFLNGYEGTTTGVEIWGDYQVADWWRLTAGVTALSKDFDLKPGHIDVSSPPVFGVDPDYQLLLRSSMQLGPNLSLNTAFRIVGDLPDPRIPGYVELDAKLAWQIADGVELYLSGTNLLDEAHPETDADDIVLQARRSIMAGAAWVF